MFAKLAILLFIHRIFGVVSKPFSYCSWALGLLIFLYSTICGLMAIFGCHPLSASWSLAKLQAKCIDGSEILLVFGYFNVFSDFLLLALPMPMLWAMQMRWRRKIGVGIVFATGAVWVSSSFCLSVVFFFRNEY